MKTKVVNTVEDHCNKMSRNVAFILNNEYLRENTIIARYEDVALSPRKFAQKMYSYFGIEMSTEISEWIEANTHGASQGSPDHEDAFLFKTSENPSESDDPFSTSKDSAKIVFDWRNSKSTKSLGWDVVELIQSSCYQMMHDFKYHRQVYGFVSFSSFLNWIGT